MPIISVVDLRKSYKTYRKPEGLGAALRAVVHRVPVEVTAVAGISFSVEAGEMVGFLGPNGAGKTTTLKMLSGLLHPTSGVVRVLDHAPFRRDAAFQRQIALVTGQKSQLWWDLPPMDTFVLNREIYDVPDPQFRATLTELIDLLGIGEELHRAVRQLSLGQRMRCELVAALLHRPRVLFLDEPTIGLDIVVQKRIREFFQLYNRRYETTVLLTSHYMDDVEMLCPRVMVINQGRLIFDGAISQLIERHAATKYVTIVFSSPVARPELEAFGAVISYEDGLSATLAIPRATHSLQAAALLNRYQIDDLDVRDPGLEDIIGDLFQSAGGDGS
ncbi:MAG TPA: ATP-binding cassette domain-containing protein [Chloroflexota bacterium]|nr:ATP-binding cassette domain-containing protein [Chloroflexota bacterium]